MAKEDLYTNGIYLKYENGDESLEREEYLHSNSSNDTTHVVMNEDTLSSIAFKYYGDPSLWYIIADVNNIYNPLEELIEGEEILIPHGK